MLGLGVFQDLVVAVFVGVEFGLDNGVDWFINVLDRLGEVWKMMDLFMVALVISCKY